MYKVSHHGDKYSGWKQLFTVVYYASRRVEISKKKIYQCCTVTVMSSELSCLSDLLSSTLLGSSKINHEKELTNNFKTKSKGEIRTTVLRDSPFHFKPAISDAGPL